MQEPRHETINDILSQNKRAHDSDYKKSHVVTTPIRDEYTEDEIEIILTLLRREAKRCLSIANAPVSGYGTANELEKKKQWKYRAEEITDLETKIANSIN